MAIAFTNRTLIATTVVSVTSFSGTNSFNTVSKNTVQNCQTGISFTGFAASSPNFSYGDSSNIVGGTLPADSNTVINFGGGAGATTASAGIHANNQRNFRCDNNYVNSNNGSGVNHPSTLRGIYLVAATNSYSSVSNNRISVKGGGTSSSVYGVEAANGGTGGTADVLNNILENCTYTTATSGSFYGFWVGASSALAYNVNGNIIKNNNHGTSTGVWYGIIISGSGISTLNLNSNQVFSNTRGGAGTSYLLMVSSAGPDQNINNNMLYDFSNTNTSTTASTTRAIFQQSGSGNIQCNGNTIYNFSQASIATSTNVLEGIRLNFGLNIAISQNTIRNFSGNAITLTGIAGAGSTTNATYTISANKIYTFSTTHASGIVSGVAQGGQSFVLINNYIGDLSATTANAGIAIAGVNATGGSSTKLYYNSIRLNAAASTGALFGTAAVSVGSTNTLELNNNIFFNASGFSGAGLTAAVRRSGSNLVPWLSSSNNNLLYAGNASVAQNVLYTDGTNSFASLALFKSFVSPRESSSFTEATTFQSTNPALIGFITPSITVPTQVEGGAVALPSIALADIEGNTRSASTPDVGAVEFAGVGLDVTGPTVSYTNLSTGTICTNNRTLTNVTISDPAGIFTGTNTKPRLYFKKQAEPNALATANDATASGWKFVETTSNASPFTFTINHSLLNTPAAVGDTIRYFVVAADSGNNVGANSATFAAVPTSVALTNAAFPVTGNVAGYGFSPQPNVVTITASKSAICVNESIVFDTTNTNISGAEYQWQSSLPGANNFSNIVGGTSIPYTFANANAAMDVRLIVSCGGNAIATSPSNLLALAYFNPTLTSVTPSTKCGYQTHTLSAVAPSGATLVWQDSIGQAVANANSFTTPVLFADRAYYAYSYTNGPLETGARARPLSVSSVAPSSWGLLFSATTAFKLYSVKVYPAGAAGNVVVNLTNSSGSVLAARTIAIPAGNGTVPFEMVLNLDIPIGTDMRLLAVSGPSMVREGSVGGFPYALSNYGSITNSYLSGASTTYYYFYDWRMVAAGSNFCAVGPTPVVATVANPPAISTSGNISVCAGSSTTVSASSGNAGYSYVFSPGNLMGASHVLVPAGDVKYIVTATDNSNGANAGCVNIDSFMIAIKPIPANTTVNPTSASVCNTAQLLTSDRPAFSGSSYASGTGNVTNTSSGYPTPLGNYNGGHRQQILFLASELTAMGIPANAALNTIGFMVSNANSAAAMTNYTIAMGHTTATALTSTFVDIATLSTVHPAASVTPVNGINSLTLANPFVWNGTSNLLVDIAYNNGAALLSAGNASVVQSATSFISVNSARVNSLSGGLTAVYQELSDLTYSQRPNTTFGYSGAIAKSWLPVTGLFRDAAATVPYAGADTIGVYALPSTTTNYSVVSTAVNNCSSQVPVVVTVDCSLPVTLLNFRGARQGKQVILSWETSQEINNHGFFVERSKDGNTFTSVGFVASKHLNGTATQATMYTNTDANVGSGTYFYRLKQTDKDGKFAFSQTIRLEGSKVDVLTVNVLYPNPVVNLLQMQVATPKAGKLHTTVLNLQGTTLLQQWNTVNAGENSLQLNVASLPAGTYRVKVFDAEQGSFVVKPFIKL